MSDKVDPKGPHKLRGSTAARSCTTVEQSFETSEEGYGDDLTIQQRSKGSAGQHAGLRGLEGARLRIAWAVD